MLMLDLNRSRIAPFDSSRAGRMYGCATMPGQEATCG